MSFGKRLEDLLEERNMKQNKLAEELNMASSTINGYIKDNRQPDYKTLIRLAEYFQVSTDYLLGLTESRQMIDQPLTMKEREMMGMYRDLNTDKQDLLHEQAEFYQKSRKKEEGHLLRRKQP